jgi:hypothetical protein
MDTDYTYLYLTLDEICSHLKLDIVIEKNEETVINIKKFLQQNRELILSSKKLNKPLYFSSSSYICFDNLDEKGWDILLKLYDFFFIRKKYINDVIDLVNPEDIKEKILIKNLSSFIENKGIVETNNIDFNNQYEELLKIISYKNIKNGNIDKNILYTIYSSALDKLVENSKINKNDELYQNRIKILRENIEKIKKI